MVEYVIQNGKTITIANDLSIPIPTLYVITCI